MQQLIKQILEDDLLTSIDIREVLIAKVPDSVRRSLNGQKLKDFKRCGELISRLKEFDGIPDDGGR